MFETLIESRGGTKRRAGGTVVSLLVHAMVVAGAVQATERVATLGGAARTDTLTFVVAPPRQVDSEIREEAPFPGAPAPVTEGVLLEMAPIDIPAMNPVDQAFDATKVIGRQARGEVSGITGEQEPASGVAGVFASAEVDDPAVALSQPAPRYPVEFERAGVHGYVELEYIIDVSGHAEPASVRVVSSSHAAFVEPAREAILAGVYRPARYRGSIVRQQVRQRVVFGS